MRENFFFLLGDAASCSNVLSSTKYTLVHIKRKHDQPQSQTKIKKALFETFCGLNRRGKNKAHGSQSRHLIHQNCKRTSSRKSGILEESWKNFERVLEESRRNLKGQGDALFCIQKAANIESLGIPWALATGYDSDPYCASFLAQLCNPLRHPPKTAH